MYQALVHHTMYGKRKCGLYIHNGVLVKHREEKHWVIHKKKDGPGVHYDKWHNPERWMEHDFSNIWNLDLSLKGMKVE